MGNKDRKNDLEFSSEELSDLQQSLEHRSSISPQGRPRKRTYRRGLKVPLDVVPHRSKAQDPVFELGQNPPARKPSSKTLPMMEPVTRQSVLQVGPPGVDSVGKDAVYKPTNPTPIDLQRLIPERDPEELPTESFLGSSPAINMGLERAKEDMTLPIDLTTLGNVEPEQVELSATPSPQFDAPVEDSAGGDGDKGGSGGGKGDLDAIESGGEFSEEELSTTVEAELNTPDQVQGMLAGKDQDPEDAATELDLLPPFPQVETPDLPPDGGANQAAVEEQNFEIPLDVAKEAVKLALDSVNESQIILPAEGHLINEFDFDAPTAPGSSHAMEGLGGNPAAEEAGERANRVAILLSALHRPVSEKTTPKLAPPPPIPSTDDVTPQLLKRLPSEDINLDFEAPEDKGSGEVEELSTEELEEVSSEGFGTMNGDLSMLPPPIPEGSLTFDGPLSPFENNDEVLPVVVKIPVAEDIDSVMTSAPIDTAKSPKEPSRDAFPDPTLDKTRPISPTGEKPRPQEANQPPEAVVIESSPIPALARGRKRKKTWFEEIFDEDWLRTLPGRSAAHTSKEVYFLEESLQPSAESQLLDLGCGDGRHTIELANRGFQVTGYDLSLPLLIRAADEAQRRSLQANFVHGDFRDLSFVEQFDAIFCLGSSFGFFDDDSNRKMIQAINSSLRVGGRFLLEVVNRDYIIEDLPSRIWWEGEGCVVLEEVDFNFFTSRIISKRSVVFEDGRHLEQEISVRSYSLHELGKILHHAGFRVLEVSGNIAHRTRYFGNYSRSLFLLAEKRPQ